MISEKLLNRRDSTVASGDTIPPFLNVRASIIERRGEVGQRATRDWGRKVGGGYRLAATQMGEASSMSTSDRQGPAEGGLARTVPVKRRRKTLFLLRSLAWALPWFALLFSVVFVLQYAFVRYQISRSIDDELRADSGQLKSELKFAETWQIEPFRQAYLDVPGWIIIDRSGTLIDIDGLLPGLIGTARPLSDDVYQHPTAAVSSLGEKWLLFARHLDHGSAVCGILQPEKVADANQRLTTAALKFGDTVKDARHLQARDVDFAVQWAVVNDSGELLSASGGVPLQVSPPTEAQMRPRFETVSADRKRFRIYRFPILSSAGKAEGLVILHKDVSVLESTLRQHILFSVGLAALAWLGSLALVMRREITVRRPRLSVAEAIRTGESEVVEFKSSFQWDVVANAPGKPLRKEVVGAVAAFLNSRKGGQVFIGVADDGTIRGLADDVREAGDSLDQMKVQVENFLEGQIDPSFASLWRITTETLESKVVLMIDVDPSREPAFVKGDRGHQFFIRDGNSTRLLDAKQAHSYIEKHRRVI